MIAGLDSATMPNQAQVRAAQAAGVKMWNGYLATRAGVKLANPWSKAAFDTVRVLGATPIAYCSGWDDPVKVKAQAGAWLVRPCLDVEGGIRDFGSWTQPWLDASGAGVYGNLTVHANCHAPFRILYGTYFTARGNVLNPNATWRGTPPLAPHGYQWWNTHTEFGVSVDRGWYDDWFLSRFSPGQGTIGGAFMALTDAQQTEMYNGLRDLNQALLYGEGTPNAANQFSQLLDAKLHTIVKAELAKLPASGGGTIPTKVNLTITGSGTGTIS